MLRPRDRHEGIIAGVADRCNLLPRRTSCTLFCNLKVNLLLPSLLNDSDLIFLGYVCLKGK